MVGAIKKADVSSILFVVVLLAVAEIAEAQEPKKVPRLGYLVGSAYALVFGDDLGAQQQQRRRDI